MKKLNVNFDHVQDTTGYLFSLAKCLCAAMRCSPYADLADDVIAASGFAFRMWADPKTLCPSAASIWDFKQQKPWVENAGLQCAYVERLWHEENAEESRRKEALQLIRQSIDSGFAPVAWDVSGCEWGLIIGYEEETCQLLTLKISGEEAKLPYQQLGKLEIPILSVLSVTGCSRKTRQTLLHDTRQLAAAHLQGQEWCENASGLAVYDVLISFAGKQLTDDSAWDLEYMLGTYAALKWYAWKFFEKYGETELAELYHTVYISWQTAFEQRKDFAQVVKMLRTAGEAETQALEKMNV